MRQKIKLEFTVICKDLNILQDTDLPEPLVKSLEQFVLLTAHKGRRDGQK